MIATRGGGPSEIIASESEGILVGARRHDRRSVAPAAMMSGSSRRHPTSARGPVPSPSYDPVARRGGPGVNRGRPGRHQRLLARSAVAEAALGRQPIVIFHQGYQLICSDGLGLPRSRLPRVAAGATSARLCRRAEAGARALARCRSTAPAARGAPESPTWSPAATSTSPCVSPAARALGHPPNPGVMCAGIEELGPQTATKRARRSATQGDSYFLDARARSAQGCSKRKISRTSRWDFRVLDDLGRRPRHRSCDPPRAMGR